LVEVLPPGQFANEQVNFNYRKLKRIAAVVAAEGAFVSRSNPHVPKIRVLVADSSKMRTQLIVNALRLDSRFEPSAARNSIEGYTKDLGTWPPDVLLISSAEKSNDSNWRLRQARTRAGITTRIVLLLSSPTSEAIFSAFAAGAHRVVSADEGLLDLYEALEAAYQEGRSILGSKHGISAAKLPLEHLRLTDPHWLISDPVSCEES